MHEGSTDTSCSDNSAAVEQPPLRITLYIGNACVSSMAITGTRPSQARAGEAASVR